MASGRVDSGSVELPGARVTVRGDISGCPKVAGGSPKLLSAAVLKLLTWTNHPKITMLEQASFSDPDTLHQQIVPVTKSAVSDSLANPKPCAVVHSHSFSAATPWDLR